MLCFVGISYLDVKEMSKNTEVSINQNSINAERISEEFPDGCNLTIVDIQLKKYLLCVIYNSPQGSAYRYALVDLNRYYNL